MSVCFEVDLEVLRVFISDMFLYYDVVGFLIGLDMLLLFRFDMGIKVICFFWKFKLVRNLLICCEILLNWFLD